MRKRRLYALVLLFSVAVCLLLSSCREVKPNGETEVFARAYPAVDVTNLDATVGAVDYVFVGRVKEYTDIVINPKSNRHEDSYSRYVLTVEENLKGELVSEIECSKMGGLSKNGTMLVMSMETPDGGEVIDLGVPEKERAYIFMAYAQLDGSLTLSEILDGREVTEELISEYRSHVENEIPFARERFVSSYAK